MPEAHFTARGRRELANPPYRQAWIPAAYRRQIVRYHRKEAPGTILVDTDARYVYYVLPESKSGGSRRFLKRREMKQPRIDPGLRELLGLSLIAAGGCGLAFSQGNFLFVVVFGAACAVMIIEATRRSR